MKRVNLDRAKTLCNQLDSMEAKLKAVQLLQPQRVSLHNNDNFQRYELPEEIGAEVIDLMVDYCNMQIFQMEKELETL